MGKMPLYYAPAIMDAVSDGISMAVRIRKAGACIMPLSSSLDENGGNGKKRQRVQSGRAPNFSNMVDLGSWNEEDQGDSGSDSDGCSFACGGDMDDFDY
jgi:hypothetical protein